MKSKHAIQESVAQNLIKGRSRHRGDCPWCGGINTFSVIIMGGVVSWKCFKAVCDVGGATHKLNVAQMKDFIEEAEKKSPGATGQQVSVYNCPSHFHTNLPQIAVNYLKEVHAYDAFSKGWADVRFDPREDRVVFLTRSETSESGWSGATGRALWTEANTSESGTLLLPKWRRYDSSGYPFTVHRKGQADKTSVVLVEDIPSACNIANFSSAIALLGTDLTSSVLDIITGGEYASVTVCLDMDAQEKAYKIAEEVRYYTRTMVALLKDDPKDMEPEVLARIIAYGKHNGATSSRMLA